MENRWLFRDSKIHLSSDDRKQGNDDGLHYVLEHRMILSRFLGRKLDSHEIVRHLNGDKIDNRLENIALGSHQENTLDHVTLRNELTLWKNIATELFFLLANNNNNE